MKWAKRKWNIELEQNENEKKCLQLGKRNDISQTESSSAKESISNTRPTSASQCCNNSSENFVCSFILLFQVFSLPLFLLHFFLLVIYTRTLGCLIHIDAKLTVLSNHIYCGNIRKCWLTWKNWFATQLLHILDSFSV